MTWVVNKPHGRSAETALSSSRSRSSDVDSTVNGLIEFPEPYYEDEHTGNVFCSYHLVDVYAAAGDEIVVTVPHELGDADPVTPRFVTVVSVYDSTADARLLEQIVSWQYENPVAAGYTLGTLSTSTTVTGFPAIAAGWSGNGVQAGDMILLEGDTEWREILSIAAGPPEVLTIEATGLATAASYRYVIRRPHDETNVYLKVVGTAPIKYTALLGVF